MIQQNTEAAGLSQLISKPTHHSIHKDTLNWISGEAPETLIEGGKALRNPKEMANCMRKTKESRETT